MILKKKEDRNYHKKRRESVIDWLDFLISKVIYFHVFFLLCIIPASSQNAGQDEHHSNCDCADAIFTNGWEDYNGSGTLQICIEGSHS